MKRTVLYLLTLLIAGCSNFLDEENQDLIIPRTVDHYKALLHREAFIQNIQNIYTDLMTDDIEENDAAITKDKNLYKSMYTWQRDIELDGDNQPSDVNNTWTKLYKLILYANYVEENIEKAEGSESEKRAILGEAHFIKGKSYLELVNLYASHYVPGNADKQIGVPIRKGTGVEETYGRSSVAKVYKIVVEELKAAIADFKAAGVKNSLWHPNEAAACLLLSRAYLYMYDYEASAEMASEAIRLSGGRLWNLNDQKGVFVNTINPEILHTYGDNSSLCIASSIVVYDPTPLIYSGSNTQTYRPSKGLMNSFLEGDLRREQYVYSSSYGLSSAKWGSNFTQMGAFNLRIAEAYLNRAEAYANTGKDELAVKDLTTLLKCRVKDMEKVDIPASGEGLKKFIFEERRREFCFEGMRLFDLKRLKSFAKQITHKFTLRNTSGGKLGVEIYLLPVGDPNYVFPIPKEETDVNPGIVQNERKVTNAIVE